MKSRMEKQNNRLFEVLWRQTLSVMVLIALSKMGATMIDGLIMARVYGADSSAAMGIVAPYATLATLIGGLISTGCQTICAAAQARGDVKSSNRIFVTAFYLALQISALITAGALLFAEPVCRFMGARGDNAYLLPETSSYLRGVCVGTAAMVLNLVLAPIVQLYAGGNCVKWSIVLLFVSDVLLDVVAVLLGLGSWGIGLSTALSNALCMLVMLAYLVSARAGIRLSPSHFDRSVISALLRQGMPEAVKRFLRMSGDILTNLIVLAVASGAAMAGKTIGNLYACLFTTPGLGAASAVYLLSGAYIAMEDERGIVLLGKRLFRYLLLTLGIAALSIILAPTLIELSLRADPETKETAVLCVRCILLSMPVYVCFEMFNSYMQSIGRGKDANRMALLGQTLLYLPLAAGLGFGFGTVGVLLSSPLALFLTLGIFYCRISRRLGRPAGPRDLLHVSECIHTEELDVVARNTVQDMESAVRCSEELRTALLGRGADARTAFAAALFVEEICSNIIEHGFRRPAGKRRLFSPREEYAMVFAFLHKGVLTLRISDNCVLFDPVEKRKSLEVREESSEGGLGLRLVFAMAEEASYTSMLNMNYMLIRVPMHGNGAPSGAGKQELRCVDERFPL